MDAMSDGGQNSYILQVGSFRNAADAEQMKARLALLGSVASVQSVTVNGQAWHRVRIGPFEGTRKTNDMRRLLSENQIDTLVMRANPLGYLVNDHPNLNPDTGVHIYWPPGFLNCPFNLMRWQYLQCCLFW